MVGSVDLLGSFAGLPSLDDPRRTAETSVSANDGDEGAFASRNKFQTTLVAEQQRREGRRARNEISSILSLGKKSLRLSGIVGYL